MKKSNRARKLAKKLASNTLAVFLPLAMSLGVASAAGVEHPEILVAPADRAAILAKVEHDPWAKKSYATLKARVDECVNKCQKDPEYMASRLFMNWETHYTTPIILKQRCVGGEGHAPVPTPRFGGARDWATKYSLPSKLEDYKPYNDKDGKVWLFNKDTSRYEWADPSLTGRTFEIGNERIMQSAADAGFIYWLTGDQKYARYASGILWTYMKGFSYMKAPKFEQPDPNEARIIGFDSFEVIHEDIVTPLAEAYDFTYDYLRKHGRDVGLIQAQLKRMADRVIAGGGATGNWNLNQSRIIAYGTLGLENNADYPDGKGRQYYVNLLLNARLPAQTGLEHVIREGYDQASGIWPEAPGYSFGTTKDIILIATLLSSDPAGRELLTNPVLPRALNAQINLLYPNGYGVGMGDTINPRLNTEAAELLLAAARKSSDTELENRMTVALDREISEGYYHRADNANLVALTQFVGKLKSVPAGASGASRTFFGAPLNVLMQRNVVANPNDSLAAAMYGTAGGHAHANGLAMELYGAGLILGADPGRGVSYWQPEHRQYYSQPPAHNTVIVNGQSDYPIYGPRHIAMKLDYVEPASGRPGMSPDISFAQASFRYNRPSAEQQRTLALIRTGPKSGFYFDVFRSRVDEGAKGFQDYLYHNIGQTLTLEHADGKPLPLAASTFLSSKNGCLVGYNYFKDEKSAVETGDFKGIFALRMPNGSEHRMCFWMLGEPNRRVFSVSAPPDHAGRAELPAAIEALRMPTMVVRQQGDAWDKPFVAVYEPVLGDRQPAIASVRAAKVEGENSHLAACVVQGQGSGSGNDSRFNILLLQNDLLGVAQKVEGCDFSGSFGVVVKRGVDVSELYLGHGRSIGESGLSLSASNDLPMDAVLLREPSGWQYSASEPVKANLIFPLPAGSSVQSWVLVRADASGRHPVESAHVEKCAAGALAVECVLPTGRHETLTLEAEK